MQDEQINNQQQSTEPQLGQSTMQPSMPQAQAWQQPQQQPQPQPQGSAVTNLQNSPTPSNKIKILSVVNLVLSIIITATTSIPIIATWVFAFSSMATQETHGSYMSLYYLVYFLSLIGLITTVLYLVSLATLLIIIRKDYKTQGIFHEKAFKLMIIGVFVFSISSIINIIRSL